MKSPDGYRTMYGVAESDDDRLFVKTLEARALLDGSGYQTRERRSTSVYLNYAQRLYETREAAEERLAEILLEQNRSSS